MREALRTPDEVLPNPKEGAEDTVFFVKKIQSQGKNRDIFAVVEVGADGQFLEIKTVIGPEQNSGTLRNARRLKNKSFEEATDGRVGRPDEAGKVPHSLGLDESSRGLPFSDVPSVAGRTIDPMEGAGKRLEELLARDADLRAQLAELETGLPTRLEDLVGQFGFARGTRRQGKASRTAQGAIKRRDAKGPSEKVARRKEADQAIMEAAEIIARSQQDLPASELDLLASQIIDRILGTPVGRLPYDQPVPSETAYGKPRNSNRSSGSAHGATAGGDLAAPLKERSFNIPDFTRKMSINFALF